MKTYEIFCSIGTTKFNITVHGTLEISGSGYYKITDSDGITSYYPIKRTVIIAKPQ